VRRELGEDLDGVVLCLEGLGYVLRRSGEYAQAQACFQEGLEVTQRVGNRWLAARMLRALGLVAGDQGHYAEARRFLEESVDLFEGLDAPLQIAAALQVLAGVAQAQEGVDMARALLERSLTLDPQSPTAWVRWARLLVEEQDAGAARSAYGRALRWAMERNNDGSALMALLGLAELHLRDDESEAAAEILGFVLAHPLLFHPLRPRAERMREQVSGVLHPALLEAAFSRGRAGGRAAAYLRQQMAVSEEGGDATKPVGELARLHLPPTAALLVEPLTEREMEVLHLLATGCSNKEIAQKLVIAVGTVKNHLKSIYGKMEVHSRVQAVNRAREIGLL